MALSRSLTPAHSGQYYPGERISTLEETRALDRFLAGGRTPRVSDGTDRHGTR